MRRFIFLGLVAVVAASGGQAAEGRKAKGSPPDSAAGGALRPYLQPGTPAVGGVRHLLLIYCDAQQKAYGSPAAWDGRALLPYVTYVDRQGKPQDWFFDSFLWIGYITSDGANLSRPVEGGRAVGKADWQWLLDVLFDPAHGVGQLESCVRQAARSLPDKDHRVNLVITIPMPMTAIKDFGAVEPGGRPLDFSRDADRWAAVQWYIRTALERWKKTEAPHVRLAGFYWLDERIQPPTRAVVRQTAGFLHSLGMKFYWIPFFGADGIQEWRQLGIDAAMLQPNYSTMANVPPSRLAEAARLARRFQMGVELELPYSARSDPERRARYRAYLDAGAKYGFMDHSILGYFQSVGLLREFAASSDPAVRDLYDQTYRFVKGTYRPNGSTPLPELPVRD